ncbi:MAG: hypothetical protein M1814_000482 [Vezdaea aestivalis]|nr:MAG: hypothetical protein M1814_000482 [Vezdaea aestivalis]
MHLSRAAQLRERQTHFRGTARLPLAALHFGENEEGSRAVDPANISRLISIFKLEGCQRSEPEHRIPAIIQPADLTAALQASNLGVDAIRRCAPEAAPELVLPAECSLQCLHGKHRVYAARQWLAPWDLWWAVDLYSSALPERTRIHFREEYSNSQNFSDGEILRYVRLYRLRGDEREAARWVARLSENKQRSCRRLHSSPRLISAIDKLLPYGGLWPAFQLGSMPTILSLRCEEEILCYLDHIRSLWSRVAEGFEWTVDEPTVRLLQCRAPQAYLEDRQAIQELMDDRSVFSRAAESEARSCIATRLLATGCMIPSLHTFFEDVKYLEPMAKAMRALVPPIIPKSKLTVRRSFEAVRPSSSSTTLVAIEESEGHLVSHPVSAEQASTLAYRQLWLFAMRHFPNMVGACPKKEPTRETPTRMEPNLQTWQKFAQLAHKVGYRSRQIDALLREHPDRARVRSAFQQIWPQDHFTIGFSMAIRNGDNSQHYSLVVTPKDTAPPILTQPDDPGPNLNRRCGLPFQDSHEYDRQFLFTPFIEDHHAPPQDNITSLLVKRDIFHAFFSERSLNVGSATQAIDLPPPPDSPSAPASDEHISDRLEVEEAMLEDQPTEEVVNLGGDSLPDIGAFERRCALEGRVAFIKLATFEAFTVPKQESEMYASAQSVADGGHRLARGGIQRLGFVQKDRLKAVGPRDILEAVNCPSVDYKSLIFFGAQDMFATGNAFGMSFSDLCRQLHEEI